MQKSPFKFLDSYSKEDRSVFFGRDKEIEELYSRVFQSKVLVLYGISGTGKSSLINCGLANKFNDSDWLPVNIRRGLNINQSLSDNLVKQSLTKISASKDIVKLIRSVYLDHFKPVFLIFDQFEEMFIFGNKSEKDEFITNVRKVIESDLQCRFIFSVREEYLAGFTEFERTIPTFLSNRIRIEKMTRQNALRVIEGPCEIHGIGIEKEVSHSLLEKLNPESPDVELTYLQVFLDKIFRIASDENEDVTRITQAHIDKVGDVKDLLGSFLEEQISRLDDPSTGLIILKSFVSVRGTRNQITEEEVMEYSRTFGEEIEGSDARNLIQKFIGLRILRDKDENGRYELRHDSLASRIYEKITLVEKELLEVRQFIENAWRNYERRSLYLSADDLKYIAPYEDKLFLNEKINRFISQSKWSIHKAKRQRQNVLIATAVILISILSFFTVWALKERSNALRQKLFAEEQKDAALKAKTAADSASKEAMASRNLAQEKESVALIAQKQSDEARKEALAEREYAMQQKNLAERLSQTANEQAYIANSEKMKAEQERSKAVAAEGKARKLGLLSMAQNLALKSLNIEKDPSMRGILAVQAYAFNMENGGQPDDPVIYEALVKAWSTLDSLKHSVFTRPENEIRSMAEKEGKLLTADLSGALISWDSDGKVLNKTVLESIAPFSYIGLSQNADYAVTQNDRFEAYLWKLSQSGFPERQELISDTWYLRTVSFRADSRMLATGGMGNRIDIWELTAFPATLTKTIETGSPVISTEFCGPDSLFFITEDGSIFLRSLSSGENIRIYKVEKEKPLCLAWNERKKTLFAGCIDGSLLTFNIDNRKLTAPVRSIHHAAGIENIAFNTDFSLMATAGRDKSIRLYHYDEFFEKGNSVGGVVNIRDLDSRIRSLAFSSESLLIAGLSDKTIRIWKTSSENLALNICNLVNRDFTTAEWNEIVGSDIPYKKCCQTK